MKKISIFCIVLLIVGLLGAQAIGTEDNLVTKQDSSKQVTEEKESKVQVAKSETKEKEADATKIEAKKEKDNDEKQVETMTIKLESGYKYSLDNIENFKDELKKKKVRLILVYNNEKFAEGYIGLNNKKDGLEYIYLPHTKNLGDPEYVRQYNKVREVIYSLNY